ncbi:MAG: DNA polymerase III subunit delta [Bdellovibrionales bacterium]|nr:DNA polymerase III subunit delta [Bdellovibrionales bacterium]
MPKIEAKIIQKELDSGKLRPIYYIYGSERMKSRELLKRIQKAVHGDDPPNDFNYEKWDGSDASAETILDSVQSFSMMGGTKLIVVRNADEMDRFDSMIPYLKNAPTEVDSSVLVLVAKGFDARKKISKAIDAAAAVIQCNEVSDQDREPWIDYLAKRRGVVVTAEERMTLRGLDPWSLELVDSELSKLELVGEDPILRTEVLLSGVDSQARDEFIDGLFIRNREKSLKHVHHFHQDIDVQLPILGLISWNLRQLKLMLIEKETRTRSTERRNPYLASKLDRWARAWTMEDLQDFEQGLFDIDFALKNTRAIGEGLWMNLIIDSTSRGTARERSGIHRK